MNRTPDALYWKDLPDGRIECALCPRRCKLFDQQRGFCFVRVREGNRMVLATYGRTSGFCVDPIEKKPLFHFLPGSSILSFGTAGCNLGCLFCQNWNLSKSKGTDTAAEQASPEEIAKAAKSARCESVAFTYNDPVIFHEYAVDTAQACREHGIKTVAVTAGYVSPEPRREFYKWMDAVNVDLKGFTENFYKKYCQASLDPVLETLEYIKKETKTWLEITTLLIPGLNDSEKELHDMSSWIVKTLGPNVPIHFTAFHPDYKMNGISPTPPETLQKARTISRDHGIRYCYTGNVRNPDGESTFCHHCGKKIIGRNWFKLTEWNLKDGSCRFCETRCPGHFEDGPGRQGDQGKFIPF